MDRFDLEQQILRCWGIIEQLHTITEGTLEHEWTPDQITNALMGVSQIYELEFDKLFGVFENGVAERKIL